MQYARPRASDLTFEEFLVVYPRIAGGDGEDDPPIEPVAPPAPPAAPAPVPGDAPWSQDLAAAFQDEAVRGQVDAFLRQQVQPRITHLEQETAPARELYRDLVNDPRGTLRDVVEELWDEETAAKFEALFGEEADNTPPEPVEPAASLPPEIQEMYTTWKAEQDARLYQEKLDEVKAANPDVEINDDWFHPFVLAAHGDFGVAVAGYRTFVDSVKEKYAPAEPPAEPPAPPAPLGTTATGGSPPPVAKQYESLDDALDDFLADVRAKKAAPTVVGSV